MFKGRASADYSGNHVAQHMKFTGEMGQKSLQLHFCYIGSVDIPMIYIGSVNIPMICVGDKLLTNLMRTSYTFGEDIGQTLELK